MTDNGYDSYGGPDPQDQPEEGSVLFSTLEEQAEAGREIWFNLHPGATELDFVFASLGNLAQDHADFIHQSWSNGIWQLTHFQLKDKLPPGTADRVEALQQAAMANVRKLGEATNGKDHGQDATMELVELFHEHVLTLAAYLAAVGEVGRVIKDD